MAWITEDRNSGEVEALAGVRDACRDVKTALVMTKMVDAEKKKLATQSSPNYFSYVIEEVSLWQVKSFGVRQSKIYKSLLGSKGLKEFFNPLTPKGSPFD